MPELGLFTPDNPVTSYTGGEAAAQAASSATSASLDCATLKMVTGALPAAAKDLGLVRAQDWRDAHPIRYANAIQNTICSLVFFKANPWVQGPTGRVLDVADNGAFVLLEVPCLLGYGRASFNGYDLAGNIVCGVTPAVPNPPDPKLPKATPGQDPTSGPSYGPGLPSGPSPSLPLGPLNLGGLNLGDVGKLLTQLGGGTDLTAIVGVVAALVLAAGGIKGGVDGLPAGLGNVFAPGFKDLASSLDRVAPGFGTVLADAVTGQGKDATDRVQKGVAAAIGLSLQALSPAFGILVGGGAQTLSSLPDHALDFLKDLVRKLLMLYRAQLEDVGPIDAGNVDVVAANLLTKAMAAGLTAQLAAFGIELLHPIKNLGMSQAVGLIAQFAGFAEIIRPYIGASLKHGIGNPAEHRAAAHFRTTLPDAFLVGELAAADLVPIEKYRERLELAGFPDPYPDAFLAHLYRPLRPGDLARLLDGSESDRPWIADRLRYAGFSPTDARKIVDGIELKTTQPGRQRLVSAALAAYAGGHLERPDLEAALDAARLSTTHRTYFLEAADIERRSKRLEAVAAEILAAYRADTLSRSKTTQVLTGLGMAADEVTARLVVQDIRRGEQQVKDEEKALELEIRETKSAALKLALAQLRAGFLDPAAFRAGGQGMGYSAAFLDVSAELELLKGKSKSKQGTPAIGSGALEESRARLAALVAQQVQLKQVDRVSALVSLRALGLPSNIVTELIDLAEALAGREPLAGHYGLRDRSKLGPLWGAVAEIVAGGFKEVPAFAPLLDQLVAGLHLPSRERSALIRLIADLRDLFRGS